MDEMLKQLLQYGVLGVLVAIGIYAAWKLFNWFLKQMEEHKAEISALRDRHEEKMKSMLDQSYVVVENNTKATQDNTRAVVDLSGRVTRIEERMKI